MRNFSMNWFYNMHLVIECSNEIIVDKKAVKVTVRNKHNQHDVSTNDSVTSFPSNVANINK